MLACAGMSPALQWSGLIALVLGLVMGTTCLVSLVASFSFPRIRKRFPQLRLGSGIGLVVSLVALIYSSMTLLLRC